MNASNKNSSWSIQIVKLLVIIFIQEMCLIQYAPAVYSSVSSDAYSKIQALIPSNHTQTVYLNGFVNSGLGTNSKLYTLTNKWELIKYTGQTRVVAEDSGVLQLESGEALVSPTRPMEVRSGRHRIDIAANTIALVSNDGNILKVRDLYENSSNSITVYVGNRYKAAMSVGQEIMLGLTQRSIIAALKAEPIARRRMRSFDLNDGSVLMCCEVSLTSLVENIDVLRQIEPSPDKKDRAIIKHLIKMAVVIDEIQYKHGAYLPVSDSQQWSGCSARQNNHRGALHYAAFLQ